jgi:hypothetical protein
MNTEYIENFFETGNFMLTTFDRCKTIEDDSRKDENEGVCNFEINHNGGNLSGIQICGKQSYMLCTSMIESKSLMEKFKTDNYLIIFDTIGFVNSISKWIKGFCNGKIGICIYKGERIIKKNTDFDINNTTKEMIKASNDGNEEEAKRLFYQQKREISESINNNLINEPYFIKEARFSEEAEVRIIWTVEYDVKEPLFIECREATNFCIPGFPLSKEYEPYKPVGDTRGMYIGTGKPFQ